jgi:uncharacterized protein (DUF2141 family)
MMTRVALLCTLCALLAARSASASELVVVIKGVDSPDGELQVELYGVEQRATFPYADRGVVAERRVRAETLPAPDRQATVTFGDLAPGSYAVSVIHDANDNGDIDLNMFGIPTEGYGFSNGARATLGPPSFDAAAVRVGATVPTRIEITLSH